MALTKGNWAVNTIQSLANRVTNQATALKLAFDKAALDIKTYINDTLTVEIDALDAANVKKTGDQTIAGEKTFSSSPIVPAPTTNLQAATKKYVDDKDTAQTSALNTHKTSGDHDGRYFTESELSAIVSGSSGADLIGTPELAGLTGTTVRTQINSLNFIANAAQNTADDALSAANGALSMASDASDAADVAIANAETAQSLASIADAKADTAQSLATTAQNTADTADSKASDALEKFGAVQPWTPTLTWFDVSRVSSVTTVAKKYKIGNICFGHIYVEVVNTDGNPLMGITLADTPSSDVSTAFVSVAERNDGESWGIFSSLPPSFVLDVENTALTRLSYTAYEESMGGPYRYYINFNYPIAEEV